MVVPKQRLVDQKKADTPPQSTLCKSSKWVLWLFRFLKRMRIVSTVVFLGQCCFGVSPIALGLCDA